jgi:DNA-binding transcriptional MocR family regulator
VIARRRQDTAHRQNLAEKIFHGFSYRAHPGSYHLWLEMPDGWTSSRFAMEAQLRGVVIAPGEAFAVDARPAMEAIRISVVAPPSMEQLEEGLRIIADLLRGRPGHHMAPV